MEAERPSNVVGFDLVLLYLLHLYVSFLLRDFLGQFAIKSLLGTHLDFLIALHAVTRLRHVDYLFLSLAYANNFLLLEQLEGFDVLVDEFLEGLHTVFINSSWN